MDLKETGCESVSWIQMIQDRVQCRTVVHIVSKRRVTQKCDEFIYRLSNYKILHNDSVPWN
jgi:hypothetical protein